MDTCGYDIQAFHINLVPDLVQIGVLRILQFPKLGSYNAENHMVGDV
jgi:hypothetical protein